MLADTLLLIYIEEEEGEEQEEYQPSTTRIGDRAVGAGVLPAVGGKCALGGFAERIQGFTDNKGLG